jgi:hypothetical protein
MLMPKHTPTYCFKIEKFVVIEKITKLNVLLFVTFPAFSYSPFREKTFLTYITLETCPIHVFLDARQVSNFDQELDHADHI